MFHILIETFERSSQSALYSEYDIVILANPKRIKHKKRTSKKSFHSQKTYCLLALSEVIKH